jgi:hypothetical protein
MKMINKKEKNRWLTAIIKLPSRDHKVMMALFSGYIQNQECFDMFAEGVPYNADEIISEAVEADDDWRTAVKAAGVVDRGVRYVIGRSLEEWDMWYFLLDATAKILSDNEMNEMIPIHDRIIAHGLFALFKKGGIDEENWQYHYDKLREKVWGE